MHFSYVRSNILCKWLNILHQFYVTMFTPEHSLLPRSIPLLPPYQPPHPACPCPPPHPALHPTLPATPPRQPAYLLLGEIYGRVYPLLGCSCNLPLLWALGVWLSLGITRLLLRPALAFCARCLAEFGHYYAAPATCPCLGGEMSGGVCPLLGCSGDLPLLWGQGLWRSLALTGLLL